MTVAKPAQNAARILQVMGLLGFAAAAAGITLSQAMTVSLSHDEHQFVVGGWWFGERGLLPYRDFPFHHLPNLLFPYGLLARVSDSLLLSARLLSVLLGVGMLGLIFLFAWRGLHRQPIWVRWLVGLSATSWLALSPLYAYATGRAWNHALPALLTLAAFLVHSGLVGVLKGPRRWLFSGALLGLAVGSRLAYLPAVVPFVAHSLIAGFRDASSARWRNLVAYAAGWAISLIPTLVFFSLAPARFIYGNLIYQVLNTRYRELLGHPTGMDLGGKFAEYWEQVILDPAHLGLALAFAAALLAALVLTLKRESNPPALFWLASGVAVFLLLGSLVPTPAWYQYFYAPMPFVVLAVVSIAAELIRRSQARWVALLAVSLTSLLAVVWVDPGVIQLSSLREPGSWVPVRLHAMAEELGTRVPEGKVLTLAPTLPAEAGLEPYPELTAGAFDWRVSQFLSPARRATYGVVSPDELPGLIASQRPEALLVGFETGNEGFTLSDAGGLEAPLVELASDLGYQRVNLINDLDLPDVAVWVRPES